MPSQIQVGGGGATGALAATRRATTCQPICPNRSVQTRRQSPADHQQYRGDDRGEARAAAEDIEDRGLAGVEIEHQRSAFRHHQYTSHPAGENIECTAGDPQTSHRVIVLQQQEHRHTRQQHAGRRPQDDGEIRAAPRESAPALRQERQVRHRGRRSPWFRAVCGVAKWLSNSAHRQS